MGRLHPRKGAHLLAGAAAAHPSAWALIAGGDEGGLASAQRTAGGCGRVVFTGHLGAAADGSDRRVWALAAADVFVLPAVGEGLPTAALEAMAAGLPLLVSHGCNLPGVEAHGAGALVGTAADRPPTLRDMTAALSAMAAHTPETRRAMGENARRWAAHAFTRTAMLDGLERLYAAVSGRETDW
jgi:glycosyltransferase involved in cell wall biosynthesis